MSAESFRTRRSRPRATPPDEPPPTFIPQEAGDLPPPAGLRASEIEVADEEYLILSFPIPDWKLPKGLSPAERDVALALLRGLKRDEIARLRGTSERTIANQIAAVFDKLRVRSRLELAVSLARTNDHD